MSDRARARSLERESVEVEYNKRTEEESPCCGLRDWSGGQPAAGNLVPLRPLPPPPSDCQHALILAHALQKFRGTEGSEEGGDARPSHRPTER